MDSAAWNERYRSADRLWTAEPNLFVKDRLAGAAPGRGVDLAGGDGRNAIWLASKGWSMVAVDFAEAALERGRAITDEVEFVRADVTDWEPDTEQDLVLIAYLHLESSSLEQVVRRAESWLAPGGELFMIGHDRSNLELGHGGPQYLEILWDLDLLISWSSGDLVESAVVRRPVETDDGVAFALDTLVRVRRRA